MDSTLTDETAAWCALLRAPGVGPQTLNPLLTSGGSARRLLQQPPTEIPVVLREYLRAPDWKGVEDDMHWLDQPRNHLLRITDRGYPSRLRELPNPPTALFLHGDPDLLDLFISMKDPRSNCSIRLPERKWIGSKFLLGEPPSTCGRSASGQDVAQNWKPSRSSGEWLFSSELNPAIYVRN